MPSKGVLPGVKPMPFVPPWAGGDDPNNDGGLLALDHTQEGGVKVVPNGTYVQPAGSNGSQVVPSRLPFFNIKDYGAKGDGATDDSAAIDAANVAAHVAGGIVVFPPGTCVNTTTHTISKPTVSWQGCGPHASEIQHNGAGDCLRVQMSPFTSDPAGMLSGLWINATANLVGAIVHLGDTVGFGFLDVYLTGATGASGVGLWQDNVTNFTERTWAVGLTFFNNTIDKRYTVNGGTDSFAYHKYLDERHSLQAGQIGCQLEGAALLFNVDYHLTCNVNGGAGNTAAVFNLLGTSQIVGALVAMCEQTSGTGAFFRGTAAGTVFSTSGPIRRGTLANNDSAGTVQSLGGLTTYTVPAGGQVGLTLDANNLDPAGGTFQIVLNGNLSGAVTIANPVQGARYRLSWIQNGAGGWTVVWPSNLLLAGGAAPVQAAAGHRTTVEAYSDGSNCFELARAVNVG